MQTKNRPVPGPLAAALAVALALLPAGAMAQATMHPDFGSSSGVACPGGTGPGGVICNGGKNFLTTELFFEPETPFASLKTGPPTWNEVEQLLDNPYALTAGCSDSAGLLPPNDQGFPTYCTSGVIRRPVFGVTLPPMLAHPLNQNPTTGIEMRLINGKYVGGTFNNTSVCFTLGTFCVPTFSSINVTPGLARVAAAEETIDYNVAIGRKLPFCQINPEPVPLDKPFNTAFDSESLTACGSDPGEPGAAPHFFDNIPDNMGFPLSGLPVSSVICSPATPPCNQPGLSILERVACAALCRMEKATPFEQWYSTPAVPGITYEAQVVPSTARLFDPNGRGFIQPRDIGLGTGGLHKPSIRIAEAGGNGTSPNYLINKVVPGTNPLTVRTVPSNENDYIGLYGAGTLLQQKQNARLEAMVLGKSLFWDMQVGSDAVQSCGTCHPHAGADNRTKNQINPFGQDGFSGTPTFDDTDPSHLTAFTFQPNHDLVATDFPFHKLTKPEVAGDPACNPALMADVTGISFPDGDPPDNPKNPAVFPVCDAANIISDTDDVASSMGVHYGLFYDIPTPGAGSFGPGSLTGGVQSVLPDLRSPIPHDNIDPIAGFAGAANADGSANEFRRVEPRNTPTIFLADFNFDNFWDGRARHDDNGGSVFGASDPQPHVFVVDATGSLVPTRQIIKNSSLASLAKGPALSKFEMSFEGRNWSKIGKKLLQDGVTPLANQLVDVTDGILGRYSNQGGSACGGLPAGERSHALGMPPPALGPGVPGLCITYRALIQHAFYPALHSNTSQHLNGCYTDHRPDIHPNQCAGLDPIPILSDPFGSPSLNTANTDDPFDGYRLSIAAGAASATDTNQFAQMEANFSLFWGQAIHLWATILVPDNTPWDQWLDANPDSGDAMGETGEPLLVLDIPNCPAPSGYVRDSLHAACFREVGNFKRDSNLTGTTVGNTRSNPGDGACIAQSTVGGVRQCTRRVPAPGTRTPNSNEPDPLFGMDIFFGSNVSLKNPEFRSGRCGACHNAPTLTDNTVPFTAKLMLVDPFPEFERGNPTVEPLMEPLGHQRLITGFLLESEINGPGQDAIERKIINESIVPAPVVANNGNCITDNCSGYSFPDAITNNVYDGKDGLGYRVHADLGTGPVAGDAPPVPFTGFGGSFFDNGVYNIGVRPCVASQSRVIGACDDIGRGNTDPFGWPLSLAALLMKNLGGVQQQPGVPLPTFNPSADPDCAPYCATGGLFEETAQDQQINPGFADEVAHPQLPSYLASFANNITVGDSHPQLDEACGPTGGCPNTVTDVANQEGFPEFPFDPRAFLSEVVNSAVATGDATVGGAGFAMQGTFPVPNRVARFGSFKAPQLREVELTGPYFHNGGKLTLRQVVDFYVRGGDFPVTNSQHRDFNILNLNAELQSDLNEDEKVALVDFLLELTDERVRFERAPFDHPELIMPLDGKAPENGSYGGLALRDAAVQNCVSSALGPGHRACVGSAALNPAQTAGLFLDVPATGTAGTATPEPNFLGIAGRSPDTTTTTGSPIQRLSGLSAFCGANITSQYCH